MRGRESLFGHYRASSHRSEEAGADPPICLFTDLPCHLAGSYCVRTEANRVTARYVQIHSVPTAGPGTFDWFWVCAAHSLESCVCENGSVSGASGDGFPFRTAQDAMDQ